MVGRNGRSISHGLNRRALRPASGASENEITRCPRTSRRGIPNILRIETQEISMFCADFVDVLTAFR
jgi:hypothetical protein